MTTGAGASPTLTVILPHFDCARYLGTAVRSVLDQDFRDLRLIVVDDASPGRDWVPALGPFAADPRLTVLSTSRNVGPMRIKNAVLPMVHGPYVGFQDADDVSLPGRFARQVAHLERGHGDLIGCGYERIDEAGAVLGRRRMPRHGNLLMRLGRSTVALHPATVVRREVLERLGGFDGTAYMAADTDFHLRAARLFRIRNLRDVLYQYRLRADSLTESPATGFGSEARRAYTEDLRRREQARRRARSRAELLPLLTAPPNDLRFSLRPVALSGPA